MLDGNEKSAAELEREKIKVVSTTDNQEDDENNDNENNNDKDNEGEEEEKENKEGEGEKEETDKEVKDEEDDEKDEEENDPEKLKKTIEKLQKRVGKKSENEKELKKQLKEAQDKLAALDAEGKVVLTEEDVQTRAEKIAADKVAENQFNKECNDLADAATKIDSNFKEKIKELAEEVAPIPAVMIGMLTDTEYGGAVLNYLTDNQDEYEEILKMSIGKQAAALNKISAKLKPDIERKTKKPVKEISKVPEAKPEVKPNNNSDVIVITGKESMKEFVAKREQQQAQRRKARGY